MRESYLAVLAVVSALKLVAQCLDEKMMITIPLPLGVESHQEEIGPLQVPQYRLAVGLAVGLAAAPCPGRRLFLKGTLRIVLGVIRVVTHDRITKRRAQLVEDRSLQQESLHLFRLPAQHLLGEIIEDVVLRAAQLFQHLAWV
jgi:hypothetical protein